MAIANTPQSLSPCYFGQSIISTLVSDPNNSKIRLRVSSLIEVYREFKDFYNIRRTPNRGYNNPVVSLGVDYLDDVGGTLGIILLIDQ